MRPPAGGSNRFPSAKILFSLTRSREPAAPLLSCAPGVLAATWNSIVATRGPIPLPLGGPFKVLEERLFELIDPVRVNLGREATAFAMKTSPDQLFTEPGRLADTLSEHFRRFVPLIEI